MATPSCLCSLLDPASCLQVSQEVVDWRHEPFLATLKGRLCLEHQKRALYPLLRNTAEQTHTILKHSGADLSHSLSCNCSRELGPVQCTSVLKSLKPESVNYAGTGGGFQTLFKSSVFANCGVTCYPSSGG